MGTLHTTGSMEDVLCEHIARCAALFVRVHDSSAADICSNPRWRRTGQQRIWFGKVATGAAHGRLYPVSAKLLWSDHGRAREQQREPGLQHGVRIDGPWSGLFRKQKCEVSERAGEGHPVACRPRGNDRQKMEGQLVLRLFRRCSLWPHPDISRIWHTGCSRRRRNIRIIRVPGVSRSKIDRK